MKTLETLHRLKKTMPYVKLARLTGVPQQSLIRWLTGKTTPSKAYETLLKYRLEAIAAQQKEAASA